MTKKSKLVLAMASMLGITAGAAAVSGFAWFTTTKSATVDITNVGVYSKSSNLNVQYVSADVNCANNNSDVGDVNIIGAADAAATVETKTAVADQKDFELKGYPSAIPTVMVTVGENPASAATVSTWSKESRTITLSAAPGAGAKVEITYYAYAALTDVSSVDGQTMYKLVWTASKEGRYATDISTVNTGFLRFTMSLTANGSSDLKVFLDNPWIHAADNDSDADVAARDRARVAIIEDADKDLETANVTRLVLQNDIDVAANNKGINASYVSSGKTASYEEATVYDLNTLSATVSSDILAEPDGTNKKTLSQAPAIDTAANKALNNYITTVAAGTSTNIIVTIWLEGTSGNDANGKFVDSPETGMINVSLPLIAF